MKKTGTIIRFTNPFTKCLNARYSYSGANEIIRAAYELVKGRTLGERGLKNPIFSRAGGDFLIFMPIKKHKEETVMLPVDDGIPLFCSTVEFSPEKVRERRNIDQLIKNLDHQNNMQFIRWLNELFKHKKRLSYAEGILNFYLSQRTEERRNNLSYWLPRLFDKQEISPELLRRLVKGELFG